MYTTFITGKVRDLSAYAIILGLSLMLLACGGDDSGSASGSGVGDSEPNNSISSASGINVPGITTGTVSNANDADDYFRFTVSTPAIYNIELSSSAGLDIDLSFGEGYISNGQEKIWWNPSETLTSNNRAVRYLLLPGPPYFIHVSTTSGSTLDYQLNISTTGSEYRDIEPNDTLQNAVEVSVPGAFSGYCDNIETDLYTFSVSTTRDYTVTMPDLGAGGPNLRLTGEDGTDISISPNIFPPSKMVLLSTGVNYTINLTTTTELPVPQGYEIEID